MHVKTLRLVTLLVWGFSIPSYAEAPSLSPAPSAVSDKGLSTESGAKEAKRNFSIPNIPAAPAMPSGGTAPLPPELPGLNFDTPQDQLAAAKAAKDAPPPIPKSLEPETPVAEAAIPPNPMPEFGAEKAPPLDGLVLSEPSAAPNVAAMPVAKAAPIPAAAPEIPALPSPPNADFSLANDAPPPLPASLGVGMTPPALDLGLASGTDDPSGVGGLVEAKPQVKTWQVKLAPSYKPKVTKFNYRRVLLPAEIYRDSYNAANRHLPIRQTMESYDQLFLQAVARNDINGTRAFLNSGRDINTTSAQGESALTIAIRAGAVDTARLLEARGASASAAAPQPMAPNYAAYIPSPTAPIAYAPQAPVNQTAYLPPSRYGTFTPNSSAPAAYAQANAPSAYTAYLPAARYHR
jgi:hypothetical protein